MSPAKGSHGHGLRPEDVDLLFPGSPDPIIPIDFKSRAAGERPEVKNSEPWLEIEEAEAPKPDLSQEPWPSPIEDAPEDSPIEESPDSDEDVDLDPGRQCRTAVQGLAKATSRAMIDGTMEPKPGPVQSERKRLPPLPSDKFWLAELEKILRRQP